MAGYSVAMSDTFVLMLTLVFLRCAVSNKIARSRPKIKEENEALE